ncbi:MAG TPA: hypothetical protein VNA28_10710 [Solirubrobacteraceae bacterium]|nr:hypothetical protein [Solirubrobacteraceae bacterium]
MPICLILDFPQLSVDDRDAVAKAINWPAEWADGCYAHGAGNADDGLRVVELWESREHWERFLQDRLQRGIGEALGGRARPPQVTEVELARFELQG